MFMVAGQLVLCAGMTISRPQCVGDSSVAGGRIGQIAGHYDNYARSVKRSVMAVSKVSVSLRVSSYMKIRADEETFYRFGWSGSAGLHFSPKRYHTHWRNMQ
jgi:hypothetical protein